jgi:hypothetical protein
MHYSASFYLVSVTLVEVFVHILDAGGGGVTVRNRGQ